MSVYRVIKDFPSRNGAEEYREGDMITLNDNQRTKALVDMGYIAAEEKLCLNLQIVNALKALPGVKAVKVVHYASKNKRRFFNVGVEEE